MKPINRTTTDTPHFQNNMHIACAYNHKSKRRNILMPSKSQKNSNATSILKEDFKLKNKSSSKLISLNRTAKRAGLTKKALACAMSFLMFCPSASVSAHKPSAENKITTSTEEEISNPTFSKIVETVKKYVKDNPGKSAVEIILFIATLTIGGYLIFRPRKPQVHSMVTPPIQQKTEDQPQPQQTTSNPEQPSALPKPTLQGAPATPPLKQPTNPQHHTATPMPTGGKVRSRITGGPHARVSSAPNPRSAPSGTSIPTHANISTSSRPTPPPLPAPLPGSSTNPASKPQGGSGRSSGRGSHRRKNATLTTSSGAGSSDTAKSPAKYQGMNAAKNQLLAAANKDFKSPSTGTAPKPLSETHRAFQEKNASVIAGGGMRKQPHAAAPRSPSPTAPVLGAATPGAPMPPVSLSPRKKSNDTKLFNECVDTLEKLLYDPTLSKHNPDWHPPSQDSSEYSQRQTDYIRVTGRGVFSQRPGSTDVSKAMREPNYVIALRNQVQKREIPKFVLDRIINGRISAFMQTEYENGRLPDEVRQLIANSQRAGSASTSSASATIEDT